MNLILTLWVLGFSLTMTFVIQRDLFFVLAQLIRYEPMDDDMPEMVLKLAVTIIVLFFWPFFVAEYLRGRK